MNNMISNSLLINSPFNPGSPQAQAISDLFILVLLISAFIFVVVTGSLIYVMFRYRSRQGEGEPRQEFGIPKLEVIWTVVPLLIVAFLFGFTIHTMHKSDPPINQKQPDLVIIAHQWWWEVLYPKSGIITANEVHIPVGKKLLARLESVDVIHDFWVPQLARKIDMTPGHPAQIWLEANALGTYLGVCSEYCGTEHAWMRFVVIAQSQADFDTWQQKERPVPLIPTNDEAARGAEMFQNMTCVNCHAIAGTEAKARIGPDLTHVASRQSLGAGILENTPSNLARWLTNPQAIKPGILMPNMKLSDSEVNALVAYLEALK
jgi:cytochrome c oxidase subunit 2